jgi:branched-chain amino acid transport system permease protein
MIGAVIAYSVTAIHGAPFWLAVVAAVTGGAALGTGIEYLTLRPLRRRGAPGDAALVATIGLALVLVALIEQARGGGWLSWLWRDGANSVRLPPGTFPDRTFHVIGLALAEPKLAILGSTVILLVGLAWLVRRTDAGRAMRAVAENPRAARLVGIDVDRVILWTVVGSSALAAFGGVLYGVAISDVSPYIGRDQLELRGLAVIVLGGMGSIPGTVLGGYILAIVEVVTILTLGTNVRASVAFAALFLMLVVRPRGLLGAPQRDRV